MSVTHAFVSPKSDGSDESLAQPSDWNANHTIGDLDKGQIVVVFDAGNSVISGNPEVDVRVPGSGTITSYTLLADASGSAVIDIWKDIYGNFPPTDADSITFTTPPTLTSAIKATDSTLTNWTKTLAAGDILRFHLDSSSTVKRLTLTLAYTRS